MNSNTKTSARVAAFFDLDGTLLPEPSLEWRFFAELRSSDRIPLANYLRWGVEALRLLPKGLLAVQHRNKRYLTGVSPDLAFHQTESISFFDEGIARLAWHAQQGHEIILVSGTLEPLAHLAAMALQGELEARGISLQPRICATRLAEERGQWTGRLASEVMYGIAKERVIKEVAIKEKLDLRQCHAYGNSLLDRQLLSVVGHGHAVNPGKGLAALANERDWPIWHWHLQRQVNPKRGLGLTAGIQQLERQA